MPRRLALLLLLGLAPVLPAAAEEAPGRRSLGEGGCVRDWLLLGPFPEDDVAARLKAPKIPDEAGAVPRPGESAGGLAWKPYHSPVDVVDFFADVVGFGYRSNAVGYAFAYVLSPDTRDVRFRMGSDDGIAVWLNGEAVWFNDAYRGVVPDEDQAPAKLLQGWNTLLVKVSQGAGQWAFQLRITDAEGKAVPGLQYALQWPAGKPPANAPPHAVQFLGFDLDAPAAGPDGAPACRLAARLRNLGVEPAAGTTVALCAAPGKPLLPAREAGAFAAWQRRTVDLPLPIETLQSLLKGEQPGVEIRVGGAVLYAPLGPSLAPQSFRSLLGPVRLAPWRVQTGSGAGIELPGYNDAPLPVAAAGAEVTPQGPAVWLRARVSVPGPLAGVPLALEVGRAGARTAVFLDGWDAGAAGGAPIPLPAGAAGCVVALKVEVDGPKPFAAPAARLVFADAGARYAGENLAAYEELFPAEREALRTAQGGAAAAFAAAGAKEFLAKTGDLAAVMKERIRGLRDYSVWYVGQSHIDMVWLWRFEESLQIFRDTFGKALQLMDEDPRYVYAQSQAAAYAATEQRHPDLFERITKAVKDGRWRVVGGMWVEPDLNLPSGESLVRQLIYGKRWFQRKLGVDVTVGWNPDSFGHCGQLPQIYRKSGVGAYYLTRCADKRRLFWWEGIDGTKLLCQAAGPMNPGPAVVAQVQEAARLYGVKDLLNPYGTGDHGGGPSREDVLAVEALRAREAFPKVDHGAPEAYFETAAKTATAIPVVPGELNFICEGCYTTHSAIKRANRRCVTLLVGAEAAAAVAHDLGRPADRGAIEQLWRIVLFNQFHDLLPGSGVHDIYLDAERDYEEVFRGGEAALRGALDAIAAQVKTEGDGAPVVVFNPLGWARSEAVEVAVPYEGPIATLGVFDDAGQEVPSQADPGGFGYRPARVVFLATDVPALGVRVFHVRDAGIAKKKFPAIVARESRLETDRLAIDIDPATGNFLKIVDKASGRDALVAQTAPAPERYGDAKPSADGRPVLGNVLQLEGDRGRDSAWWYTYTGERWRIEKGARIQVVERGPVRATVRITRTWKDERPECTYGQPSTFQQDVVVYGGAPRIDLVHDVDWNERYKALKLAFGVNAAAAAATAEIPYGAIARPVKGADYPMQNWVDLSDAAGGLSVLNNGRYGYDVCGSVLRVHLLRASFDPDPEPDHGRHRFTVSLLPHAGDWRAAGTPRRGWELNQPLVAWAASPHAGTSSTSLGAGLPAALSFVSVDASNVNVGAVKRAEDSDALVVRLYEAHGEKSTAAKVKLWKPVASAAETDLLEREMKEAKAPAVAGDTIEVTMGAYEIKTVRVVLK